MASSDKLPVQVQESLGENQDQRAPEVLYCRKGNLEPEESTYISTDNEAETKLKEGLVGDELCSGYAYDSFGPSGLTNHDGCTNASESDISASSSSSRTLSPPNSTGAVAIVCSELSKPTLDSHDCASFHTQSGAHDEHVAFMHGKLRQSGGDVDAGSVGTMLSCSGSSSAYSIITHGSSFDECTECQALDESIPSKDAKDSLEFWRSVDRKGLTSEGCHIKLWTKFLAKVEEKFPEEKKTGLKDMKTISLLKTLLKVNLSDDAATVEYKHFVRVVTFFGPMRVTDGGRCILIQQIQDVAKNSLRLKDKRSKEKLSWFAGDMTRDEAESKLEKQKSGTFLIRMSGTRKGCFVISVIDEDALIHHFEIEADYDTAAKSNPFSANLKLHGNTYHSLVQVEGSLMMEPLIDEDDDVQIYCQFICPGLPLNGVITGYKKSRGGASASNS